MSKKNKAQMSGTLEEGSLKSYPAPWKGQLLLACAKCQRKLRRLDREHPLAKLQRVIKHCARQDEDHFRLRVVATPCLKLCPKGGVTVCTQEQLGRGDCSILRTKQGVCTLVAQTRQSAELSFCRQSCNKAGDR